MAEVRLPTGSCQPTLLPHLAGPLQPPSQPLLPPETPTPDPDLETDPAGASRATGFLLGSDTQEVPLGSGPQGVGVRCSPREGPAAHRSGRSLRTTCALRTQGLPPPSPRAGKRQDGAGESPIAGLKISLLASRRPGPTWAGRAAAGPVQERRGPGQDPSPLPSAPGPAALQVLRALRRRAGPGVRNQKPRVPSPPGKLRPGRARSPAAAALTCSRRPALGLSPRRSPVRPSVRALAAAPGLPRAAGTLGGAGPGRGWERRNLSDRLRSHQRASGRARGGGGRGMEAPPPVSDPAPPCPRPRPRLGSSPSPLRPPQHPPGGPLCGPLELGRWGQASAG